MVAFDKSKTLIVKGVAILMLLFHHLFLVKERLDVNGVDFSQETYAHMYKYVVQARICVWIFVFLSAYGMAKQIDMKGQSFLKYAVLRWINLMKQWWITMLLMLLLYGIFAGNLFDYYNHSVKLFILDFVEWNDFFDYPRILGSWYICFTQILIIVFPVVYCFCKKFCYLSLPIFFILMQFCPDGIVSTGGGSYMQYIPTFIGGVFFAQTGLLDRWLQRMKNRRLKSLNIIGGIGMILLIILLEQIRYSINDVRHIKSMVAFLSALLIIVFVVQYLEPFHKVLGFFGKHSASLFMTNVFFYIEFPKIVYFFKNPVFCYLALLLITVCFSYITRLAGRYLYYDRCFDKLCDYVKGIRV